MEPVQRSDSPMRDLESKSCVNPRLRPLSRREPEPESNDGRNPGPPAGRNWALFSKAFGSRAHGVPGAKSEPRQNRARNTPPPPQGTIAGEVCKAEPGTRSVSSRGSLTLGAPARQRRWSQVTDIASAFSACSTQRRSFLCLLPLSLPLDRDGRDFHRPGSKCRCRNFGSSQFNDCAAQNLRRGEQE